MVRFSRGRLLILAIVTLAVRDLRPRRMMIVSQDGPQAVVIDPARMRPLALLGAAGVSILIGLYAGGRWETWLYFWYGAPFRTADPLLGGGIGFYVFTLPLLEVVH